MVVGLGRSRSLDFGRAATPVIEGLAVAAAALAGGYSIRAWQAYKVRPIVPRMRK